jgi:hypothetical protein
MAQSKGSKPAAKPPAKPAAQPPRPPPSFGKLYWLRLTVGVISGVLSYYLFSATPINLNNTTNGILVAIIIYLATYYFARYAWYRKLSPEYISKLYTTGVGGFIMLFLFSWILLFTFFSGSA